MKLIVVLFVFVICSLSGAADLVYPETRLSDQVDDYFGTPVRDPYRWLEDVNSVETLEWIAAQNELSNGFIDAIEQDRKSVV